MKKIVIAVDGYSSCGKSTFAKRIAAQMGYIFIDTGAMYRGVTLYAMQNGVFASGQMDKQHLIEALSNINISFKYNPSRGASDLLLNGQNVESEIRMLEVSERVSQVSSVAEVREFLVRQQQELGHDRGVVMDGRDIGTVVFPDAELKIFMTADPHIRALRRYDELRAKGDEVSLEEIERNICERDRADETRTVSPLRKAADAMVLDNSHMSVEEQMEWVKTKIEQATR